MNGAAKTRVAAMLRSIRTTGWVSTVALPLLMATAVSVAAAGGGGKLAGPEPAELSPKAAAGLLLDVAYTGMRFVAVGERGNIVFSANGKTWEQAKVPARSTLTALSFTDSMNGWAVGHDAVILKTGDGGRTWEIQHFAPDGGKVLLDVAFLDGLRGLAVGAFGTALSTEDGGKTWRELTESPLQAEGLHLNAVAKLGDGALLAVGENGALFLSQDAVTWERLASPYSGTLFGVVRRGTQGALVFGLRGNAYVTQDVRSGAWTKLDLGTTQTTFGGITSGNGDSLLVGSDGLARLIKANGGVYSLPRNESINTTLSAAVSSPYGVFAVGEKGVSEFESLTPVALPQGTE